MPVPVPDFVTARGSCGGAATMVIENAFVDVLGEGVALSVTWIVKLDVPADVGVPEIDPVEGLSDNPGGRLPDKIAHVYGG